MTQHNLGAPLSHQVFVVLLWGVFLKGVVVGMMVVVVLVLAPVTERKPHWRRWPLDRLETHWRQQGGREVKTQNIHEFAIPCGGVCRSL